MNRTDIEKRLRLKRWKITPSQIEGVKIFCRNNRYLSRKEQAKVLQLYKGKLALIIRFIVEVQGEWV